MPVFVRIEVTIDKKKSYLVYLNSIYRVLITQSCASSSQMKTQDDAEMT